MKATARLASGQPEKTVAELLEETEQLRAQLAAATAKKQPKLTLKVSEKGAVSLYGLGRFPVTLYAQQWCVVLSIKEQIEAFIASNESRLKSKE